jgi:predicted metal-dependent hydrolase
VASMATPADDAMEAASVEDADVEVRRSRRRSRTVTAYREGDRTIVVVPQRMSDGEVRRWTALLMLRLERRARRTQRQPGDAELVNRAHQLSQLYLEGRAVPLSIRWVDNQRRRWGSCTPADRSIRMSSRLQEMPTWVVDYVIVHELAHLLHSGHGPNFWAWVHRYPLTERARGYLEGVATHPERDPPRSQN